LTSIDASSTLPPFFVTIALTEGERIMSSELLTVHEIALALRVDDTTVRRWIKSGVLEAIELPHRNKRCAYRIRRDTLDKLLTSAAA
jgi:excisionase family DNA binding protein